MLAFVSDREGRRGAEPSQPTRRVEPDRKGAAEASPAAPGEGVGEPDALRRARPWVPPRTSHGHARRIPSLRAGPLADKAALSSPELI